MDKRVDTWLEIVPAVLEELGVKHVALMSHSAGTFYAFNTAVRLPHLMYPGKGALMACLGEFAAYLCAPDISLCCCFMLVWLSTLSLPAMRQKMSKNFQY